MREIVLYEENGRRHAALLEEGALCEYRVSPLEASSSLAGAILKGRVERVLPGMDAAFVQAGLSKNGFLPFKEAGDSAKDQAERQLKAGQEVLVQVKKDPVGEKGAYLTRDITFPGTYVIFMPYSRFVGVSKRVQKEEERVALLSLGREIAPKDTGLVMRSAALGAGREEILLELDGLIDAWNEVEKRYPTEKAPKLLWQSPDPLTEMIREYQARGIGRITTNAEGLEAGGVNIQYQKDTDLLVSFGIAAQVEKALHRKVWLKSGGYLIFDLCEAMTVIDVNTGKFTGKKLLEETIFALNAEACQEIARQIRLRNLGGILIIDFIDMGEEQHRQALLEALKSELQKDRVKTVVHGYTSLGLVECTRKKTSPPLHETLTAPCPRCMGGGRISRQNGREGETSNHE